MAYAPRILLELPVLGWQRETCSSRGGPCPVLPVLRPGASVRALWARHYTEAHGLALVPIPPGEKGPTHPGWNKPRGFTTDPAKAENRWRLRPDENMGALHSASGTATLDLDHAAAPDVLRLVGVDVETLLDQAAAVSVGNPDHPLKPWYRVPEGLALEPRKLTWPSPEPGGKPVCVFELRAGAVQDVLPPSLHPCGSPYRWARFRGFSPLPDALLDLWQRWDELLPAMQAACPWAEPETTARAAGPSEADWTAVRAEVLRRYSLAEALAEAGITLGRNDKAPCPFHDEKVPSFWTWTADGIGHWCCGHGGAPAGRSTRKGHSVGDALDLYAWRRGLSVGRATAELAERFGVALPGRPEHGQAAGPTVEVVEPWSPRQPLPPDADPVPTLPAALIPEPLRPWLEDVAQRASIPLECPTVPALVALGSVVGRTVAIRPEPRDDWQVVPNLWGGIVARPGFLKSAAVEAGLAPLGPLVAAAREEYHMLAQKQDVQRIVLESQLAAAKRKKGGASEGDVRRLVEELRDCRVPERRYLTNDGTPEKLGEILRDNPRGILLARDELAGWLRGFDKPGREGEREFFLEGWNGTGSFTVDRIGRGTVYVPALCLSVVGSIQPGKLRAYVAAAVEGGGGADGLLQRVQLLVWPDRLDAWKPVERWPDGEAKARAFAAYAALDRLTADAVGAETPEYGLPFLRFNPEAQALFLAWRTELERRLRGGELDACPAFEAHLAKYRSLMPSLALLFHLAGSVSSVSASEEVPRNAVGLESAQRAAAWCEYLEAHARKLYAVELLPGRAAARALATKVEAGAVTHRQTVRELYRPQWEVLKTPEAVAAGLGELERLGWLKVAQEEAGQSGGRPRAVVLLHPELRQRNGGAR